MRSSAIVVAVACAASVMPAAPHSDVRATTTLSPRSDGAAHAISSVAPSPAVAIAPRAGFAIRVSEDGHPVADARVWIADGSETLLANATSDREGVAHVAELAAGPYVIWATSTGRVSPIVRAVDLAAEPVELALEPAGELRGDVIAGGPAPAGTVVQLTPLDLDHVTLTATVDAHGAFALASVPVGRWRIDATVPGYIQTAEQSVHVAAGAARDAIAVRLERAGSLAGVVVDGAGNPVANATLVLRRQGGGARPAAQPAVSYGRGWVYPFAGRRQIPANASARFGASRPGTRPAECGDGHCGIDLVMPRGTVVTAAKDGTVVAASMALRGEAGRLVAIEHGGGLETMYMHLDHVNEALEPGQKIAAGTPVGTVGTTGFDPTKSVAHLHFALTQRRGGRTWYLDPEPMLRRSIVMPLDRVGTPLTTVADAAPPVDAIATDSHGAFHVDGLEPGSYVAVAFASELAPSASPVFAVQGGEVTGGVAIAMHPGATVRGRVVGRDGPIAGATVFASAGAGEATSMIASASTDAHGEYVLRALVGKVEVAVTAARYSDTSRTLELDPHEPEKTPHREDFSLAIADAMLRGQVRTPEPTTAPISIRVIDGPSHRGGTADATGQFALDRIATGHYVVEVSCADYPAKRFTLDSDRWQELRLDAGGGARAVVSDARSGQPLAGVVVSATGPGGAAVTRATDARGVVEWKGLAAGTWTLSSHAHGYTAVARELAVRASRMPDELRLDLVHGATLGGVVRDRRGNRIAGARVSAGGATTQTDADGNFHLSDVVATSDLLAVDLDGRAGALALRLAPGDERLMLEVELGD